MFDLIVCAIMTALFGSMARLAFTDRMYPISIGFCVLCGLFFGKLVLLIHQGLFGVPA